MELLFITQIFSKKFPTELFTFKLNNTFLTSNFAKIKDSLYNTI